MVESTVPSHLLAWPTPLRKQLSQAGDTFVQPHHGLNVWSVHSIAEFSPIGSPFGVLWDWSVCCKAARKLVCAQPASNSYFALDADVAGRTHG